MNFLYRVHQVDFQRQPSKVVIDGVEENVVRDMLEVQLTGENPGREHGSITLRCVGADVGPARELFVQDGLVSLNFEVEPETKQEYEARRNPLMDESLVDRVPESQLNHPNTVDA